MAHKNKSLFKGLLETVSKLPQWVGAHVPVVKKKSISPFAPEFSQEILSFENTSEQEFEEIIHGIFKQRGYTISEKRAGAFDGVDLVLLRDSETTYVQYSHWNEAKVDITTVGELYVAMEMEGVKYGIVLTSGSFTAEALDFSLGKSLVLINGEDLSQMIAALQTAVEEEQINKENHITTENNTADNSNVSIQDTAESLPPPLCPLCNNNMIKRTAKKGKNAGNTFWGCSKFPSCRGVISM